MQLKMKFLLIGTSLVIIVLAQIWLRNFKMENAAESEAAKEEQKMGEIYNPHITDGIPYQMPERSEQEITDGQKKKILLFLV